jgi:hypothetical protein
VAQEEVGMLESSCVDSAHLHDVDCRMLLPVADTKAKLVVGSQRKVGA